MLIYFLFYYWIKLIERFCLTKSNGRWQKVCFLKQKTSEGVTGLRSCSLSTSFNFEQVSSDVTQRKKSTFSMISIIAEDEKENSINVQNLHPNLVVRSTKSDERRFSIENPVFFSSKTVFNANRKSRSRDREKRCKTEWICNFNKSFNVNVRKFILRMKERMSTEVVWREEKRKNCSTFPFSDWWFNKETDRIKTRTKNRKISITGVTVKLVENFIERETVLDRGETIRQKDRHSRVSRHRFINRKIVKNQVETNSDSLFVSPWFLLSSVIQVSVTVRFVFVERRLPSCYSYSPSFNWFFSYEKLKRTVRILTPRKTVFPGRWKKTNLR